MAKGEVGQRHRQLAGGAAPEQVLEALARGLTNKFLHAPISLLNDAASAPDDERRRQIELLARFYQQHE